MTRIASAGSASGIDPIPVALATVHGNADPSIPDTL
jgi:hypothetical protein